MRPASVRWYLWSPQQSFVVAVGARLVPVLRGGGLAGDGNYDDAVHYTAAAGLVNGRMPYADFLFLHPPGSVVALAPFAAFGALTSHGTGMAVARLVWMLIGGLNTALVVLILRRIGLAAAISGGLFCAWYFPASTTNTRPFSRRSATLDFCARS